MLGDISGESSVTPAFHLGNLGCMPLLFLVCRRCLGQEPLSVGPIGQDEGPPNGTGQDRNSKESSPCRQGGSGQGDLLRQCGQERDPGGQEFRPATPGGQFDQIGDRVEGHQCPADVGGSGTHVHGGVGAIGGRGDDAAGDQAVAAGHLYDGRAADSNGRLQLAGGTAAVTGDRIAVVTAFAGLDVGVAALLELGPPAATLAPSTKALAEMTAISASVMPPFWMRRMVSQPSMPGMARSSRMIYKCRACTQPAGNGSRGRKGKSANASS